MLIIATVRKDQFAVGPTLGASIYPGYHGPAGFGSVIVVTLYALLDGLVCGALFAWLYNAFAVDGQKT